MFTCKQVSKSLQVDDYNNLPPIKKCMLKLHVALCVVCGKFNRQVMDSHDMCRKYKEHESELESSRDKLDENKKKGLKELLAEQSAAQSKE